MEKKIINFKVIWQIWINHWYNSTKWKVENGDHFEIKCFFYDDHDHDDDYCSTTVPDNIRMKILGLYGGIKKMNIFNLTE